MAEKKKYNSILVSGRKDETLTYSRFIKDEESGESVKESLDKKVNATDKLETHQIKDCAITNEKLAADSVGNTNLQDGSVSNEKLEGGSITNEKLAENSITKDKLKDNTIGIEKLDPELRQTINAATGLPENLVETIQNVDDTLKEHQSQLDDKQSQIDDKQQQITANDEDISLLQTRSTQMEETIKSIAATGGASQATAVTYNNTNSQLTATNIQSAVDELQGSKIDKTSISQESGEAEDKVMSQKETSRKFKVLEQKVKNISGQTTEEDDDRVSFENNNGEEVASVDAEGIKAVSVKVKGSDVLTEQDLTNIASKSELDKKQDKNNNIKNERTNSQEEEIIVTGKNDEEILRLTEKGLSANAFFVLNSDGSTTPIAQSTNSNQAKPVILDTDFGGDIDDLSALAMLCYGERIGLIDIIGVCSSVPRTNYKREDKQFNVISAMDAICEYFGINDMAFGLDMENGSYDSSYCGTACSYPHTIEHISEAYDAPEFYRRGLASLETDKKCDVAIIGYLTAFSRFLDSDPDAISNLSGESLANSKIDTLYIVGGQYPEGAVETNFGGGNKYKVNATANVFAKFKNRIIFIGGQMSDIHCGNILLDESLTWSMIYNCMNEFMQDNYEERKSNGTLPSGITTKEEFWHHYNFAWDVLDVIAMIDNNPNITGIKLIRGKNSIIQEEGDDFGKNVWADGDFDGIEHYRADYQEKRSAEWHTHRLDSIIKEDNWMSSLGMGRYRIPRKVGITKKEFNSSITLESSHTLSVEASLTDCSECVLELDKYPTDTINVYGNEENTVSGEKLLATLTPENKQCRFLYRGAGNIYLKKYESSSFTANLSIEEYCINR